MLRIMYGNVRAFLSNSGIGYGCIVFPRGRIPKLEFTDIDMLPLTAL